MIGLFRLIWALITRKRYVSKLLMVNGSAWWDQTGLTVSSFEKITKSTAIWALTDESAKLYFPVKITEKTKFGDIDSYEYPTLYRAEVKLHTIMMKQELEKWVEKVDKNPFI